MPVLTEIVNEKLDRLESVPEKFISDVDKAQIDVFREVEKILLQLDRNGDLIELNERNLSLVNSLDARLKDAVFNDEYIEALTDYTRQFRVQADLNNKYFTNLDVGYSDSNIYANTLRAGQENALSLLGEDAFTQNLIVPIKQMMEGSINTSVSFIDTVESLREFIQGTDDQDGRLLSSVKRVAFDAFSSADRNYTNVIANDLGLEFYRYQGGKVEDSRDFCLERAGKYFHKKEIELWGEGKKCCGLEWPKSGTWQGRNTATTKSTIFTFAGGYNCKHGILPVSLKSVPKDVVQRNIESGNYKP